ncbi:hypothetical protein RYX36_025034 [Vicia faba]
MQEHNSPEPNPKPKLHGAFSSSTPRQPPPPPPPSTNTEEFTDPFVEDMFKNLPMPLEELNRQNPSRSTLPPPPPISEDFEFLPASIFDDEPEPLNMIYPLHEGNYPILEPGSKGWTPLYASNIDERISSRADPIDTDEAMYADYVNPRDFTEPNLHRHKVSAVVSPSISYVSVNHDGYADGAGIANLRNTCFMAAILQCLTHTRQLFFGLRYCLHDTSRHDESGFCAICAFRDHNDQALEESRNTIYPTAFLQNVNKFSTTFVPHAQEDAHEFLFCALNKLKNAYPEQGLKNNLIEQIFGGETLSKLRCRSCGFSSDTVDPTFDLGLVVEDMETVQRALDAYIMVENMDGTFNCSGCNQEVYMEKQLLIDTAPEVAVLHLKRFKKDRTSYGKIEDHVYFTMELDLEPYTSAKGKESPNLKYDLYAVVVHSGSTANSGHYFSYVRSDEKAWHLMDDSKVFSVSEEHVLAQQAYLLFYAKQGTGWFSSIVKDEERVLKSKSIDNTQDFGCSQMDHYILSEETDYNTQDFGCSKMDHCILSEAPDYKTRDFGCRDMDFGCKDMDCYILSEATDNDSPYVNDDDLMRANDCDSTHGIDTDSPNGKEKTASDMEEEECDSAGVNDKDSKDANEKSVSGMDGEECDLADVNDDKDSKDANEKSVSGMDGEECDLADVNDDKDSKHANDDEDSKDANEKSLSGTDGEECDLADANDDKDSKDANDDKDSKNANEKSMSGTDGEECDLADANDDNVSKECK